MNRRQSLKVFGAGVTAKLSAGRPVGPDQEDALRIRIVPTSHREKGGRAIELSGPSRHFHVVITNVSPRSVRLWKEWCSWGYFNLSFRVTDEAGASVQARKKDRGWDRNFPDFDIIPPGSHHVREVTFDPTTWEGSPLPAENRHKVVRMMAV
ncbi:hypothetical protein [Aquisphaera insulae]|uniref:hypothetical protein n=1 Tax=Aquisphaera insulae TaxID=2712864 RepID=UPI0013EB1917|nr:hypothetical protein [Aquisphaera insulae]